ncbi:hypothetical protein ACQB6R_09595 [Propionibacteriaceae bacterium G1746]|uniref:hypothetical protein n=1 Tax=Aestuariimicrobium sp. G57 TaxID=3418485 RepID=UPI003C13185D
MSGETETALEPDELQVDQEQVEPAQPEPLDEAQLATLTRLLRVMYPHAQFPDGPYQRTAEKVRDGAQTDLAVGLGALDGQAGGSFLEADEAAAAELIAGLGFDDEFLLAVHSVAINTLYDDHEVWALLGYEGASYDKGGYINRGFNDLDWLPDPRITEFDGEPRTENVPLAGRS